MAERSCFWNLRCEEGSAFRRMTRRHVSMMREGPGMVQNSEKAEGSSLSAGFPEPWWDPRFPSSLYPLPLLSGPVAPFEPLPEGCLLVDSVEADALEAEDLRHEERMARAASGVAAGESRTACRVVHPFGSETRSKA